MTLAPEDQALARVALDAVVSKAQAAHDAPDLEAARLALNAVWFAVHRAQEALNDVERKTRQAALAKLERAA